MSYAFKTLKRQILATADGDEKYTMQELDRMVCQKYRDDKLTDQEYRDLCDLLDHVG